MEDRADVNGRADDTAFRILIIVPASLIRHRANQKSVGFRVATRLRTEQEHPQVQRVQQKFVIAFSALIDRSGWGTHGIVQQQRRRL